LFQREETEIYPVEMKYIVVNLLKGVADVRGPKVRHEVILPVRILSPLVVLPFVLDLVPHPVEGSVKSVVRDEVIHGQHCRIVRPFVFDEHPAVHAELTDCPVDAIGCTGSASG
jgi:hypothetical protein